MRKLLKWMVVLGAVWIGGGAGRPGAGVRRRQGRGAEAGDDCADRSDWRLHPDRKCRLWTWLLTPT